MYSNGKLLIIIKTVMYLYKMIKLQVHSHRGELDG